MSLVKFKNRRRPLRNVSPLGNFLTSDFFDTDDFFNDRPGLSKLDEPAMNINETDDHFEIELAAPGYSKKDFEVTIDNGYLNVSADKSISKEEEEKDYTYKEFSYSTFEKSLLLPENVKEEDIKAKYKDGILSFNLTKKEQTKKAKPKVIEIS